MRTLRLALLLGALVTAAAPAMASTACAQGASTDCYFGFRPAGAQGDLHYFASRTPDGPDAALPTRALIALHGHLRDADKTFNAALLAVRRGGALDRTLVVAPVFQVATDAARKCSTPGVPSAQPGDLLWTCASWLQGGVAANDAGFSAFAALDALVAELRRRWPELQSITIAGFSAGAQMVQHYIGFAHEVPDGGNAPRMRYVVSDPGTWLYFDPVRPQPIGPECPHANQWKYGTDDLPPTLGRTAAEARARYAAAEIHYLEGELDDRAGAGTAYRVLDKSCAAQLQGPFRLQRGLAYAAYDRALLAPDRQRQVTVVPGCAHDVACVFPAPAARAALLGAPQSARPR